MPQNAKMTAAIPVPNRVHCNACQTTPGNALQMRWNASKRQNELGGYRITFELASMPSRERLAVVCTLVGDVYVECIGTYLKCFGNASAIH